MSVQSQLADIFSLFLITKSIDEVVLPLSRKRKERDEDEVTSQSAPLPSASIPKSNLENLGGAATGTARKISKLLGGEAWKTQPIGSFGFIQTKSPKRLQALQRVVKTSLQIHQVATVEAGFFNSDLVEALTRAHHQRLTDPKNPGDRLFTDRLSSSDYERAKELLKDKIEENGEW